MYESYIVVAASEAIVNTPRHQCEEERLAWPYQGYDINIVRSIKEKGWCCVLGWMRISDATIVWMPWHRSTHHYLLAEPFSLPSLATGHGNVSSCFAGRWEETCRSNVERWNLMGKPTCTIWQFSSDKWVPSKKSVRTDRFVPIRIITSGHVRTCRAFIRYAMLSMKFQYTNCVASAHRLDIW